MCNSLNAKEFISFRAEALKKTKERLLSSQNMNVTTVSHIAEVLKKSQMVNGNLFHQFIKYLTVGKGRSASMLAGPNPKKRKLNDVYQNQIGGDEGEVTLKLKA